MKANNGKPVIVFNSVALRVVEQEKQTRPTPETGNYPYEYNAVRRYTHERLAAKPLHSAIK